MKPGTEALINAASIYGLTPAEAEWMEVSLLAQGFAVYRKKHALVGRRKGNSRPMTPQLKEAIKAAHAALPNATMQDIANQFNVNIGRVSEAFR